MARSLIDIAALDSRIQEQIAEYGSCKDFHLVLWRQKEDAAGCNWNAHIERIRGDPASEGSHQSAPRRANGGQARDEKTAGEKTTPAAIPILSRCPQKRAAGRPLHRSQDLPYSTFAVLTHESFAGPANASHFSIATL